MCELFDNLMVFCAVPPCHSGKQMWVYDGRKLCKSTITYGNLSGSV